MIRYSYYSLIEPCITSLVGRVQSINVSLVVLHILNFAGCKLMFVSWISANIFEFQKFEFPFQENRRWRKRFSLQWRCWLDIDQDLVWSFWTLPQSEGPRIWTDHALIYVEDNLRDENVSASDGMVQVHFGFCACIPYNHCQSITRT